MVTAGWVALILLGAVLYAVLVYLISIGFRAEGMRDPATAPCDRPRLVGASRGWYGGIKRAGGFRGVRRYHHYRAA